VYRVSTLLSSVMSPDRRASFRRRGDERVAGRDTLVFDYAWSFSRSGSLRGAHGSFRLWPSRIGGCHVKLPKG
jgi:hypothetical protein